MSPIPSTDEKAADAADLSNRFRSGELLGTLLERLLDSSRQAQSVLVLHVIDPEQYWTLDLSPENPHFRSGQADDAVANLRISEADLGELAKGRVQPADLYQRGRLRVEGDMHLARKVATALYKLV